MRMIKWNRFRGGTTPTEVICMGVELMATVEEVDDMVVLLRLDGTYT